MRTSLRKIGNSRGVLIPATLLVECGISDEIEMRLEGSRIVIEPVKNPRNGWFKGYQAQADSDAWEGLSPEADSVDWEW